MVDGTIKAYRRRLAEWIGPRAWATSLETIGVSDKYVDGHPVYYPGLSVVSPPGPESPQWSTVYQPLSQLRDKLLSTLHDGGHQPVPDESLHLTGADLVAGPKYDQMRAQHDEFEKVIADQVSSVWHRSVANQMSLRWRFAGLAFFQHALVCLLEPIDVADYDPLIRFREALYADPRLSRLGVKRTKPFMAHVTLSYYTSIPAYDIRQSWVRQCEAMHAEFKAVADDFTIDALEVRQFDDMTAYHSLMPRVAFNFG